MKTIPKTIGLLFTLAIASCGNTQTNMHEEHDNLNNQFTHVEGTVVLDMPYMANEKFVKGIEALYGNYLELEKALVFGDPKAVNTPIGTMLAQTEAIATDSLGGEGLTAWDNHKATYTKVLEEMQHADGLDAKRAYFAHLSELMYCTLKSFATQGITANAAFCPMAFGDKGAYWLTDGTEIRNPYFGETMLKCGKIKEKNVQTVDMKSQVPDGDHEKHN